MIRAPFEPLHPRSVTTRELLHFGNKETIKLWREKGKLPHMALVAIRVARHYGVENFSYRMEQMTPGQIHLIIPEELSYREVARSLGISLSNPSSWAKKGASPINGAAQMLSILDHVGWFDDLVAVLNAEQQIPSLNFERIPADRYTRPELEALGGYARMVNWVHEGEISARFSAIARVAEEEGIRLLDLDLPDKAISAELVSNATAGLPRQVVADYLGTSMRTVSTFRGEGVSPAKGFSQLIVLLDRVGRFDQLRRFLGVAIEPKENNSRKGFFFYGEDPRFARATVARSGAIKIGPVCPTIEEAMKFTPDRLINKRNVRNLEGQRYATIAGENVALLEVSL